MPKLQIIRSDVVYRIFETESAEGTEVVGGTASSKQAIGNEQLKQQLAKLGATPEGIQDVLKQLRTSNSEELDV